MQVNITHHGRSLPLRKPSPRTSTSVSLNVPSEVNTCRTTRAYLLDICFVVFLDVRAYIYLCSLLHSVLVKIASSQTSEVTGWIYVSVYISAQLSWAGEDLSYIWSTRTNGVLWPALSFGTCLPLLSSSSGTVLSVDSCLGWSSATPDDDSASLSLFALDLLGSGSGSVVTVTPPRATFQVSEPWVIGKSRQFVVQRCDCAKRSIKYMNGNTSP